MVKAVEGEGVAAKAEVTRQFSGTAATAEREAVQAEKVAADGKASLARVAVPTPPVKPAGKFEGKVKKEFEKQTDKFKRLVAERDATSKAIDKLEANAKAKRAGVAAVAKQAASVEAAAAANSAKAVVGARAGGEKRIMAAVAILASARKDEAASVLTADKADKALAVLLAEQKELRGQIVKLATSLPK
mmetsp:Transcript_9268/g.22321  ORF Transcript_9268/g.22321 Transcript_9268/m.22321 type:complete len:189 (-) Transcript_9268:422-988(-)